METDQRKILGAQIRKLREERGMTQEQLAVSIGNGTKQYISALEKGSKNVTFDVICRVAEALDADIDIVLRPRG